MEKDILLKYLKTDNKSGQKTREKNFKSKFPELYQKIIQNEIFDCWYSKLYSYIYDLESPPKCKNNECKNTLKFKNFRIGYYDYCSISCRNKDKLLIKKTKETNINKYGVDNPMKINLIKEKIRKTKFEKYGDENYNNQKKSKKTKLEKYGDENYNNRIKNKKTKFEKYGDENYTNRNKALKTNEKKYGNKFYNNKEKIKKSLLEKYSNEIDSKKIINKRKNTCLKKYGVDSFTKTKEYKKNINNKTIKSYADKINLDIKDISLNNDNFKISNYCKTHDFFKINRYVLKNRILYGIDNICTKCNPVSQQSSIKEGEIFSFIKNDLNIINVIENSRKILKSGQELDIYLPDHNIAIEFNGLYWHSNFFVGKNYHLNKTIECEKQGIQLLHIFEDEWVNKKNIIKSIIRNKLNLIENKIYARKTTIKEITDNGLVREFLETNHIQGFVGSKIKLGLFYNNNELVSLMTFGKKRKIMNSSSEEGEYELLRFCNKINTTVIGGASKLFKFFIKNYEPKEITTYADRRYSNGNLYKQLEMEYVGETPPNYWYFKNNEYERKHRFGFRKDILIKKGYDPSKTEHEIMVERGYLRIYDCGNLKYKFNMS